ncbi:MAG: ThuA domain-containing protein [Bacteroidia bacterium]|nr:ThuA domain-containing protein [Bacteroidia bacterium]
MMVTSCQKHTNKQVGDRMLKALIVDGQNNHGIWPKTTAMMKDYLEQTGLFEVTVERTGFTWQGPHNDSDEGLGKEKRLKLIEEFPLLPSKVTEQMDEPKQDPNFKPDFTQYDVVITNFGWTAAPWPVETQEALESFVQKGGGLVIIHAANNSFPEWAEYNKMIGIGGWGDRSEKSGPYVYYDTENKFVRDTTKGTGGMHGYQYEFAITVRDATHPITLGMPSIWLHAKDELYDRLRGPAENLTVLGTAFSDVEKNASFFAPYPGTGRNEPMIMTLAYGEGRVFHTPLGHSDYSMECVGFITIFQRGVEWAASGKVSQELPSDFPSSDKTSQRKWNKKP